MEATTHRPPASLTDRLLGLWVILCLCAGFGSWMLGDAVPEVQGNRPLAAKPSPQVTVGSSTWMQQWAQWLKERLPLRYYAIQARNAAQLALAEKLHPLPVSPGNWLVSVGAGGWMFFGEEAAVPPRKDTHQVMAADAVKLTQKMLASGRRFYLVMVPDKITVYPDEAPTLLKRADQWSRRGEMEELMRQAFDTAGLRENYLDWPTLLRGAKEKGIWCPHDTHWNETGALVAVRDLLERLQPGLATDAEFVTTGVGPMVNDLRSSLLLLPGEGGLSPRYKALRSGAEVLEGKPVTTPDFPAPPIRSWTCKHPKVIPGHTVVVVDSFMQTTGSLMAPWFERLTFIHESYAQHRIMRESLAQADTIVWTSVQRIIRGRLNYWASDAMPASQKRGK